MNIRPDDPPDKECEYCGSPFQSNIQHKVFCKPACKKKFETVITGVMKGIRPFVIDALKTMRDDRN